MDTRTGRIFEVAEGAPPPARSVPLTKQEAEELGRLGSNRARLRRYKKAHAADPCRSCGEPLKTHTLRQFQEHYDS